MPISRKPEVEMFVAINASIEDLDGQKMAKELWVYRQ